MVPALCKNIGIGATWREMIGPHGTPLVFFFNRKLTEGPIPILLQSAGTNAKQKKVQKPMSKFDESAGTSDTFKLIKNKHIRNSLHITNEDYPSQMLNY